MTIATLDDLKDHLSFTPDMGDADDMMLRRKLVAAQSQIERQLGFKIEARFGGQGREAVPADLVEAVLMLAAWWYGDGRETAGEGAREIPWGVAEIISSHRDWSF